MRHVCNGQRKYKILKYNTSRRFYNVSSVRFDHCCRKREKNCAFMWNIQNLKRELTDLKPVCNCYMSFQQLSLRHIYGINFSVLVWFLSNLFLPGVYKIRGQNNGKKFKKWSAWLMKNIKLCQPKSYFSLYKTF